ncbi:MAG: hypothetical protein AUJ98_05995 [Bacteroidetes bacterium CG2_30_33_31]|nr:MAG: hypothetical protein AUJ98_05995 [Bacteroidetes bacterium CG2_30_33_31]
MLKKVLFIDTTHPVLPRILEENGFECHYFLSNNLEDLKKIIGDFQAIIVRSKFTFDMELLSCCTNLKCIGRVGAGMENINVEFAENRGIKCLNAPQGNRDAVGEHALGMLLNLFNNINVADAEVRSGIWKREENRGYEINGKTVAIIGYGNMGSSFAKKLLGFEAKIIAYDKYKSGFGDDNVSEVSMQEVFNQADIVSLHLPLTEETKFLVNKSWIEKFQKEITLINTSRGKIVQTSALVNAMKSSKIFGACLDVLEYEKTSFENLFMNNFPTEFQYLINSKRVVLSPHIAGWTYESNIKLAKIIAKKIVAVLKQ